MFEKIFSVFSWLYENINVKYRQTKFNKYLVAFYEKQLKALLSGEDKEMNLATLTEQAFALLDEDEASDE